jgi:hypothetical protein
MSTTPLTPDQDFPYTIVGKRNPDTAGSGPGIILLNRSSRLVRRDYIAEIVDAGFSDILSVESRDNSFSVEALSSEFPTVRFLLLDKPLTTGGKINLAMNLIAADQVLVMWSTMELPTGTTRASESLAAGDNVVLAPALRGERGEALPVVQIPALQRRALRILSLPTRGTSAETLFPFDYVGLYQRRRFQQYGLYNEQIERPFWQKLDFGFRLAMWGAKIQVDPTFRMSYRSMPEPEDQTATGGYDLFYARNLAVRIPERGAVVPLIQALPFSLRGRRNLMETIRVFRSASRWVEENRERFLRDARTVIADWSVEHG